MESEPEDALGWVSNRLSAERELNWLRAQSYFPSLSTTQGLLPPHPTPPHGPGHSSGIPAPLGNQLMGPPALYTVTDY